MNCDEARELMATTWKEEVRDEPALPQAPRDLRRMQSRNGGARRFVEPAVPTCRYPGRPSLALHARWHATFASLMPERRSGVFWQLAFALACLVIGVLVGANLPGRNNERNSDEIAKLRQMVALSLLQEQSAGERLRGVDYTGSMQNMQPAVVSALIQAVAHDANVNVRLAAVDALSKVATHPGVVESLTRSLPQQDSPMVQAELIDYLINAHDRQAVGTLEQLAARPNLNPAVRERTHYSCNNQPLKETDMYSDKIALAVLAFALVSTAAWNTEAREPLHYTFLERQDSRRGYRSMARSRSPAMAETRSASSGRKRSFAPP